MLRVLLFIVVSCMLACTYPTEIIRENEEMRANPIALPGNPDNRKSGWQQNGGLTISDPSKTVAMQADFRDSPAQVYTVQFSVIKFPTFGNFSAVATITFKIEGALVTRKVSVGDGVSLSGVGQAIDVDIVDTTQAIASPGAGDYTIQVTVSRGVRPSNGQPPVLVGDNVGSVAASGSSTFSIPTGSGIKYLQVYIASPTEANSPSIALVTFKNAGGISVLTYDPVNYPDFIVIPPNAAEVTVDNLSTTKSMLLAYAWGIDG